MEVTSREFVVFDIEDTGVEGILGADGDKSEEESRIKDPGRRIQENGVSTGYRCDNLLVIIFHSALVTSFEWASG